MEHELNGKNYKGIGSTASENVCICLWCGGGFPQVCLRLCLFTLGIERIHLDCIIFGKVFTL